MIDRFTEAATGGNADGVVEMMVYRQQACVEFEQVGSPPPCPTGVVPGSLVDGFEITQCDGREFRRDEAEPVVRAMVTEYGFQLYSVARMSFPRAQASYRVALLSHQDVPLYLFHLSETGIVAITASCYPVNQVTPEAGVDYIVPPPERR